MPDARPIEEPISPELVLVSPELREQAIAALPDPSWDSILAQVRARAALAPAPERERVSPREGATLVWHAAAVPLLAVAVATAVTLVLTVIADAKRSSEPARPGYPSSVVSSATAAAPAARPASIARSSWWNSSNPIPRVSGVTTSAARRRAVSSAPPPPIRSERSSSSGRTGIRGGP